MNRAGAHLFSFVTLILLSLPAAPEAFLREPTPAVASMRDDILGLFDAEWDADAQMLGRGNSHSTRGTMFYSASLLIRDRPEDRDRAIRGIRRVIDLQYDAEGLPWHGTYRRNEHEADPSVPGARIWENYDPNWREFISLVQIVLLEGRGDRLPEELKSALYRNIRRACEGAFDRRVRYSYTNIALMSAYLLAWGGKTFDTPAWLAYGEELAEDLYRDYRRQHTFQEHNSPTYYGVDFLALALWRGLPPVPEFETWGTALERDLWREVGQRFHAGLGNLCGPFDRSYGMDMRAYWSIAGEMIAIATGQTDAIPDIRTGTAQKHDAIYLPLMASMGVHAPEDVLPHLVSFQGARRVNVSIEDVGPLRASYSWLTADFMVGVETVEKVTPHREQFHPFTIHWRDPDNDKAVNWMKLRWPAPIIVRLEGDTVILERGPDRRDGVSNSTILVHAGNTEPVDIATGSWKLPGLAIQADLPGPSPDVQQKANMLHLTWDLTAMHPGDVFLRLTLP